MKEIVRLLISGFSTPKLYSSSPRTTTLSKHTLWVGRLVSSDDF